MCQAQAAGQGGRGEGEKKTGWQRERQGEGRQLGSFNVN